jgi:hypothetical protein
MPDLVSTVRGLLAIPVLLALMIYFLDWLVVARSAHPHGRTLRLYYVVLDKSSETPASGAVIRLTTFYPAGSCETSTSSPTSSDGRTWTDVDVRCVDSVTLLGIHHHARPWPSELRVETNGLISEPVRLPDYARVRRWWERGIVVYTDRWAVKLGQ